jgi:N4-(beta-N-acetylglucosaminyl)-L-asparaginase
LYVDGEVGAAGSTGRGEANLYSLASFLIVEGMRRGLHPKDAGLEALERIKANTVPRLLNPRGEPGFNINFYIINRRGDYAGVAMYSPEKNRGRFAVCDEKGARLEFTEPLLAGSAAD